MTQTPTIKCRAKDPNLCRFHSPSTLLPLRSYQAKASLEQAFNLLTSSSETSENYLANREAYKEAEENYYVTAEGIRKLEDEYETLEGQYCADVAMSIVFTSDEEYDALERLRVARNDASLRFDKLKALRGKFLRDNKNKFIEEKFNSTEIPYAKLAVFNMFITADSTESLDSLLKQKNITREQFYDKIKNPNFRQQVIDTEHILISEAKENNDPIFLSTHERTRKLYQQNDFILSPELIRRANDDYSRTYS